MSANTPPKLWFPLWQYLNQPLFDQKVKLILNPKQFWQNYQVEHLLRCWEQESSQKGHPHT
uniref:Uncharacterized protein n=1 Tax=Cyanothece sp. (strain PCC 7425 / ATCC 29141) TaxID=395961 RepID=B8HUI2_CYAP4